MGIGRAYYNDRNEKRCIRESGVFFTGLSQKRKDFHANRTEKSPRFLEPSFHRFKMVTCPNCGKEVYDLGVGSGESM